MATLWEIITGNSTLPVDPANTFWDHLNSQNGDGGGDQPTLVNTYNGAALSMNAGATLTIDTGVALTMNLHADELTAIIDADLTMNSDQDLVI